MSPKTPPTSPPTSPTSKPVNSSSASSTPSRSARSRNSSFGSVSRRDQFYTPSQPSGLRRTTFPENTPTPSPEDRFHNPFLPRQQQDEPDGQDDREQHADAPDEHTSLLGTSGVGEDQGIFSRLTKTSARPRLSRHYDSFNSYLADVGNGIAYPGDAASIRSVRTDGSFVEAAWEDARAATTNTGFSTAKRLARKWGINDRNKIYFFYYIPFLNWITQYKWSYFRGDFIAALTMASFYIPMALSLAANLGHVPALNGLYAFVFNPLIYALLGTCPQMVVGPEAAGSLLTGQVVKDSINKGHVSDKDGQHAAEIAGITTFTAGFVILLGGIFRLGFLDNVLSRPFQRGFISAIGIVIFIDQLIPELGLTELAGEVGGVNHGSCVDKLIFLFQYAPRAHAPTAAVSLGAFAIIMVCRETKKHFQPRFPAVAYVPDRFVIVVLSAVFAWCFRWDKIGIEVLGDIKTSSGSLFRFHWPYASSHLRLASDAFSTSFIIALLGFFESSVAAKSLGVGEKTNSVIQNMHLSPNRELVALGTANVVGGLFMSLPAFGGYGRSKVNASTGGRTPMSSICLAFITLICILFMTPYFHYLPKGVLAAMISVVAYSLLEEIPEDLIFFIRIRGYSELVLMCLIFLSTLFWNLKIGIAVGIGLSLLRVIQHSVRPRIQILGRVPGTEDRFENAEREPGRLEFFEGCLIVKIPEPLTFANTGSLKSRLRRLEEYGTGKAHPAMPPVRRKESNKKIIFDVQGVTSLDGAGAQVLRDIVEGYVHRGVRVVFCRCPAEQSDVWQLLEASGVVRLCGGREHFVGTVQEALAITESEGGVLTRPEDEEADGMTV